MLLVLFAIPGMAKDKKKDKKEKVVPVYIWGASMSFSDSIVYFTEIEELEGVVLEDGMLPRRQYYSYLLKDYMSFKENMPGRMSVIFFSEKRSKLEKKEMKIKKRLMDVEGKTVLYLGDKFKFVKP